MSLRLIFSSTNTSHHHQHKPHYYHKLVTTLSPFPSSIRLIQNLNLHICSYLTEQSIIDSHEIVLSNGDTGHAIKYELGFLMFDKVVVDQFAVLESLAVDVDGARGDKNNFVSDGVELLICSQRIPNFPFVNLMNLVQARGYAIECGGGDENNHEQ